MSVETDDLEPLESGFREHLGAMFARGAVGAPFMPPSLPVVSESDKGLSIILNNNRIIETLLCQGNVPPPHAGNRAEHYSTQCPGLAF